MYYVVKPGDSLWLVADRFFDRADQWPTIAQDNRLGRPDRIWVGQSLFLRDSMLKPNFANLVLNPFFAPSFVNRTQASVEHATSVIPARGFMFVLADEVNPFTKKLVRKVLVNPDMAALMSQRVGRTLPVMPNPAKFGLMPTDPLSSLPLGRHALGMKPSAFSSASSQLFGSPRIEGSRFWIDVAKAEAAGASIHGTPEILADLDRISAKTANAASRAKIDYIKNFVRADAEVLVRGPVPASAIKGAGAMAMTRGLQGVQIIGFTMTAIDLKNATQQSIAQHSAKPIAAESIRQVGGWAASWAGMKLGALGGAALGIETGPGAIATGIIGGIVGGFAGYFGADWVADHIDAN